MYSKLFLLGGRIWVIVDLVDCQKYLHILSKEFFNFILSTFDLNYLKSILNFIVFNRILLDNLNFRKNIMSWKSSGYKFVIFTGSAYVEKWGYVKSPFTVLEYSGNWSNLLKNLFSNGNQGFSLKHGGSYFFKFM